jgi:peptidoglycan/LPS O-acetylase OafA/YrhL
MPAEWREGDVRRGLLINRQFAALRGLAMILVVLNHSIHLGSWYSQELGYAKATGLEYYILLVLEQLGVFAVPIFLFVSGSFFVYAVKGKELRSAYKIVRTNLGHVVFPYILWSIVFYILIYVWLGQSYSPLEYIKNLIVGYPFNFVPLLIFFYLLSPVLVAGGQRLSWLLLVGIGLYQIILLNLIYPGILGFQFPSWMHILEMPVLRTTIAIWGIYFPLGVVYSLYANRLMPILFKWRWFFLCGAVALFVLNIVRYGSAQQPPIEGYLAPLFMSLLLPSIKRDQIPQAQRLELVGKRSYGLYLMHFNIINIVLFGLSIVFPTLLGFRALLLPLLFIIGLSVPLVLMNNLARHSRVGSYRYVFG